MNILRSLIALAFTIPVFSPSLRAQTVSPVPAPTIITTAPYTISKPGYYQLGADLTISATSGNIITIAASNVTLDFAGHYISGPNNKASTLYGVYASEAGNLIIENGTVAFCYRGIDLTGNGDTTSTLNINQQVNNLLVSYCFYEGIYFYTSVNSAINNCRISYIGGSTATNSYQAGGIILDGVDNGSKVANCTINNVKGGSGTYQAAYGIEGQTGSLISGNVINNVTVPSGNNAYGILEVGFTVGNTISNCHYGVFNGNKYKDNLTSNCASPFTGGNAVGSDNN